MKTAVVYYTMSENTKYAAEKIAENWIFFILFVTFNQFFV